MKPQSAKSKGRALQKLVRDTILSIFTTLEPDDVRSTPMGSNGEDIMLSPAARRLFPYQIECKNVEKLNIWDAIAQASSFGDKHAPLVVFKRNGMDPHVAMSLEHFRRIYETLETYRRIMPGVVCDGSDAKKDA